MEWRTNKLERREYFIELKKKKKKKKESYCVRKTHVMSLVL